MNAHAHCPHRRAGGTEKADSAYRWSQHCPPLSSRRTYWRTHSPGFSRARVGHRFYNPSTGRWISRDPIGVLQAFTSPGYPFYLRQRVKYVCCAKNKLPEPRLREGARFLENGQDDPATYYINSMNGLTGDLVGDWSRGIDAILDGVAADCKSAAK
jgi:hypothetical protein